MEQQLWRKCLIKDSAYPTLVLREVWALQSQPHECKIDYLSGKPSEVINFFIINLAAPGQNAPLSISEHDIKWLKRGPSDVMSFQPPMVDAATWLDLHWTGL